MTDAHDHPLNGSVPTARARLPVLSTLVTAAAFEALMLTSTQVPTLRAHTPWQDDPYATAVSFALVYVPLLAALLVVGARCACGAATPDAEHRLLRTALLALVVIDVTVLAGWVGVSLNARHDTWTATTAALSTSLAVVSVIAAASTAAVIAAGATRRSRRPWRDDWLSAVEALAGRNPRFGRLGQWVEVVRSRALLVFVAISALGGGLVVGAQAYGERWTDPWLIGWAFVIVTVTNLGMGLIGNRWAGFVGRRSTSRPHWEVAIEVASVSVVGAVAFHDPIWTTFFDEPMTEVRQLTTLTAVVAVTASAAAYAAAAIQARPRRAVS